MRKPQLFRLFGYLALLLLPPLLGLVAGELAGETEQVSPPAAGATSTVH